LDCRLAVVPSESTLETAQYTVCLDLLVSDGKTVLVEPAAVANLVEPLLVFLGCHVAGSEKRDNDAQIRQAPVSHRGTQQSQDTATTSVQSHVLE